MSTPSEPTTESGPGGWGRRRWAGAALSAVFAVIVVLALTTFKSTERGVQSPKLGPLPERADAVVVFAGEARRQQHALELMEDGLAPVLVISLGTQHQSLRAVCGQEQPFEVRCPDPAEESSRSEARLFGELAMENDWRLVVGVTSDYHVQRAHTLFERCFDGSIVFAAPPAGSVSDGVVRRETLGGLHARFLLRGC